MLQIQKYKLDDGTEMTATKINVMEISAKVNWIPLSINTEVAECFSQFGKPIESGAQILREKMLPFYPLQK